MPHLLRITNLVTPAEKYEFSYSAAVTLTSPFTPNGTFGTTVKLERITHVGLGLYHEFTYAAGSNEMVKAKLPYGAELEWGYAEGSYLNGQRFREVGSRWLRTAPGAAQWAYAFSPYAPSGAQSVVGFRYGSWRCPEPGRGSMERVAAWPGRASGREHRIHSLVGSGMFRLAGRIRSRAEADAAGAAAGPFAANSSDKGIAFADTAC